MLSVSLVSWNRLRTQSVAELRGWRYPEMMPSSWNTCAGKANQPRPYITQGAPWRDFTVTLTCRSLGPKGKLFGVCQPIPVFFEYLKDRELTLGTWLMVKTRGSLIRLSIAEGGGSTRYYCGCPMGPVLLHAHSKYPDHSQHGSTAPLTDSEGRSPHRRWLPGPKSRNNSRSEDAVNFLNGERGHVRCGIIIWQTCLLRNILATV